MADDYDNQVILQAGDDTANTAIVTPNQQRFYASERCSDARHGLARLVDDPAYDTDAEYYRLNDLTFMERHLQYLSTHPLVNVDGYLSNLRLMTRRS